MVSPLSILESILVLKNKKHDRSSNKRLKAYITYVFNYIYI